MTHVPDRRKEHDRRHEFVNTGEASEMLGGLLSPGTIRSMALKGEIKGALRVRQRVLIPIRVVPTLVRELNEQATITPVRRPRVGHTTLDGELAS